MNPDETSEFAFADGTTAFGDALLNAPALRAWPPSLDEAREILAGQPYEVIERIGYGGMGAVFRVHNLEPGIDRPEAVKIRRPEARDDERFRERFLREIATLAQLRHPGLTTVFRSGESAAGYLWFSMECLEGKSLADLTAPRQPPLAPERVLDITRQLCTTLQFIHEKGRLHRDLKPANVMVCDDGSVRLLDFGIASGLFAELGFAATGREASANRHLTHPGESPHTPAFAAPEQINGGETDARTDLYGFGRIVHAMIHPPGASPARPGCYPPRLLDLVDDLLAFDRGDRPASAAAVAEKLGQLEPGTPGFWGHDRNPFRGLATYQPEHSEIFFGRDAAIRRGLELLQTRTAPAWHGFLLITGASGSGKSSLARAGLGPALLRDSQPIGADAKPPTPVVCDLGAIRPEHDCLLPPLARALAAGLAADPAALLETLRDANSDLAHFLPPAPDDAVTCCLILDQFEQFFRAELPRAAQTRFLAAIARLATTPGVVVLVTLRSDCYHLCESQPQFMELKDGRHLDLPPPQPWEIATLLRLSARAADLTFETAPDGRGLDDILLEHARRNPQALPLLSYLLDQLWEQRDPVTNTLRHATYEALGGFEGAIAEKARATCQTFAEDYPSEAQPAFDALFHLLVEAHDAATGISFARRRAPAEELAAAAPAVHTLAERLVAARLLVQDDSGLAFAHDALLSPAVVARWETLDHWLETSTRDLIIRDRVTQRCHDWTLHARAADLLLPAGSLLAEAETLLQTKPALFPADQRDFIHQASTTARETARRSTRRRRLAFSSLTALTTLAVIAALWATKREREAVAAKTLAISSRNEAENILTYILGPVTRRLTARGGVDDLKGVQNRVFAYYDKLGVDLNDPDQVRTKALAFANFGDICLKAGDVPGAERAYQSALADLERVAAGKPEDYGLCMEVGVAKGNLSKVLRASNRMPEAAAMCDEYVKLVNRAATAEPDNSWRQRELAVAFYSRGDLAQSLADHQRALEIRRKLAAETQASVAKTVPLRDLGGSLQAIALLHKAQGDWQAATASGREALEIREKLCAIEPSNAEWLTDLAVTLRLMATLDAHAGDARAAFTRLEKARDYLTPLFAADPANAELAHHLGVTQILIANQHRAAGELEAARRALVVAIETMLPIAETARPPMSFLATLCMAASDIAKSIPSSSAANVKDTLPLCQRVLTALDRNCPTTGKLRDSRDELERLCRAAPKAVETVPAADQ